MLRPPAGGVHSSLGNISRCDIHHNVRLGRASTPSGTEFTVRVFIQLLVLRVRCPEGSSLTLEVLGLGQVSSWFPPFSLFQFESRFGDGALSAKLYSDAGGISSSSEASCATLPASSRICPLPQAFAFACSQTRRRRARSEFPVTTCQFSGHSVRWESIRHWFVRTRRSAAIARNSNNLFATLGPT